MYLIYIYLAFQFIVNNPSLFYYGARLLRFSLSLVPQVVVVVTSSIPLTRDWDKINSVYLDPGLNKIIIDTELVEIDGKSKSQIK